MNEDPLDLFVEELLDIARENPIDDARIIIRDRLVKDAPQAVSSARSTTNAQSE